MLITLGLSHVRKMQDADYVLWANDSLQGECCLYCILCSAYKHATFLACVLFCMCLCSKGDGPIMRSLWRCGSTN